MIGEKWPKKGKNNENMAGFRTKSGFPLTSAPSILPYSENRETVVAAHHSES